MAILAAVEAGCTVVEYAPAEIKRAVVGYGRAEKHQVQDMIKILWALRRPRRRTTQRMHWPSRFATCTRCRRWGWGGCPGPESPVPSPQSQAQILASVSSSRQRMIAFLRGRILDKQPNLLIVDVQGVGYLVHVPLSTFYDAGERGAEAALHIHTHVREEALQLYGFLRCSNSSCSSG